MDDIKILLLASIICFFMIAGCKDKKSQVQPNGQTSTSSQSDQATPSFGAEQNDAEGYDGHLWGSRSTQGYYDNLRMNYNLLLKVVGPPGDVVNGWFLESKDTAPTIKTYTDIADDNIEYGLYNSQLAFVMVHLKGSFEDAHRRLNTKYSSGIDVAQDAFGDGSAPGKWEGYSYTGTMYQRGKTNTRIYLMRSFDEDGNTRGVYLLYIPNTYLLAIRKAWWGGYNSMQRQTEQEHQADAAAARKADQQAIQ